MMAARKDIMQVCPCRSIFKFYFQNQFFASKGADCKPEKLTSKLSTDDDFIGAPSIKKQCSIPRQDSIENRYTEEPCGARSKPSSPTEGKEECRF